MKTVLYLATPDGLSVISGNDGGWRGETKLKGNDVRCVVSHSQRPGLILCGTYSEGLWRSIDSGATWKSSTTFAKSRVSAVATSHLGSMYAGTEMSAVFQSDDAGETWRELQTLSTLPSAKTWSFPPHPETHHVQSILASLAHANRLHVAIEAGALLSSEDAGRSWLDRVDGSPRDTHSLAAHSSDPQRLHSAAGDGYFESIDDGKSWHSRLEGLRHQYCWSIAVSSEDASTLLMSTASDAYAAHFRERARSFLYRKTKNERWHLVANGLPEPEGTRISVLAASQIAPATFYAAAEGEIYQSKDGGLQWQKLRVEWADGRASEHALAVALIESLS